MRRQRRNIQPTLFAHGGRYVVHGYDLRTLLRKRQTLKFWCTDWAAFMHTL